MLQQIFRKAGASALLVVFCSCAQSVPRFKTREKLFDPKEQPFLGVNIYSLAGAPPESGGFSCGRHFTDEQIDEIFGEIRSFGVEAARFFAFQSFTSSGDDFRRLDSIVQKAERRGLKLIIALENQWPDCTEGGYKTAVWYRRGYTKPYGAYKLSYRDYAAKIVNRYKTNRTIAIWQLMNEPESRTDSGLPDREALRLFADEMSRLIKSIDGGATSISLGTIGGKEPGVAGRSYERLAALPAIDVVEAHDYDENASLGLSSNRCLVLGRRLGKPCFIGEMGVSLDKYTPQKRATIIEAKLKAAREGGAAGIIIWSYRAGDGRGMDFDFNDPLVPILRQFSSLGSR